MARKNKKEKRFFHESLVFAQNELRQWRQDYRVWMVFCIEGLLMARRTLGFTIYGLQYGTKSTPWILSLFFGDGTIANGLIKILIYLGVLVLFCNAPFLNRYTPYLLLRGKRKNWVYGEVLYIVLASALYLLFLFAITFVLLLPSMSLSQMWGSTVYTFCSDYYSSEGNGQIWAWYTSGVPVAKDVINHIYPHMAFLYTCLTAWLSFVLLGLVIFAANLITHSQEIGVVMAGALILLDPVVGWFSSLGSAYQYLLLISPVSWSSIEHLQSLTNLGNLTIPYILEADLILIVILIASIRHFSKKMEIQIR